MNGNTKSICFLVGGKEDWEDNRCVGEGVISGDVVQDVDTHSWHLSQDVCCYWT